MINVRPRVADSLFFHRFSINAKPTLLMRQRGDPKWKRYRFKVKIKCYTSKQFVAKVRHGNIDTRKT